jgi:hypothetical protein
LVKRGCMGKISEMPLLPLRGQSVSGMYVYMNVSIFYKISSQLDIFTFMAREQNVTSKQRSLGVQTFFSDSNPGQS